MIEIKPVEMLAAALAGSPRRPVYALITETYLMLASDSLNVTKAINIPIDGSGPYIDNQLTALSSLIINLKTVVVTHIQKPEVMASNMTTGAASVNVRTITNVLQDQKDESMNVNMTTGLVSASVRTITNVLQDQKGESMNVNMTTGLVTVVIT